MGSEKVDEANITEMTFLYGINLPSDESCLLKGSFSFFTTYRGIGII